MATLFERFRTKYRFYFLFPDILPSSVFIIIIFSSKNIKRKSAENVFKVVAA